MSRTNEARQIEWYKTCKCKCRLDASVCNNKQRWNKDKCIYENWLIKNWLIKEFVITDLFGIVVIVIVEILMEINRLIIRLWELTNMYAILVQYT